MFVGTVGRRLTCTNAENQRVDRVCSSTSLEPASSWIGGIDPRRPAGRNIQIGDPDLRVLERQVSCDVDMALAAVDNMRLRSARDTAIVARVGSPERRSRPAA
jgi:hypothetical protein